MKDRRAINRFDPLLLIAIVGLIGLGLVMITSASIAVAQKRFDEPFYYTYRQAFCIGFGLFVALVISAIPMKFWYRISGLMMMGAIGALVLVLIPGIGKEVNGSARWLNLGVTAIQISEFCKLVVIFYIASYVVRHQDALKNKVSGFIKPMLLLSLVGALLILEPDFGATVVMLSTALAMLFLAGVPLWQFMILLAVVACVLAGVAISAPYRMQRLTSFLDPWSRQFDSGYQLTQALIAFGRGEWFGVGLGGSVQKLFYLPEAYTDFIFAVLAEELGLFGALATLALYGLFVWRGMMVGLYAQKRDDLFSAFVAYGISLWVALQTLINIGVNTGVLPTKGLTLPFLSYGGSSTLVLAISIGLLMRVDIENRLSFNRGRSYKHEKQTRK